MKLTISRDPFLSALRQCLLRGGPVGNPNLGLVALTATKILKTGAPDMLTLRASIGIVATEVMVAATLEEEGEIAVDCKALRDTVAGMPAGDISVELKKDKLYVKHGARRWVGKTLPAQNVSVLPLPGPDAEALVLPAAELLTMIDRVKFAIAAVPGDRPSRVGIFLDVKEGEPTAIVWGDHLNCLYCPVPPPPVRTDSRRWQLLLTEPVIDRLRELALEKDSPEIELRQGRDYAWLTSRSSLICFSPPIEPYVDWRHMLTFLQHSPICRLPRLALLSSLAALISAADALCMAHVVFDVGKHELSIEHHAGPGETGRGGSTDEFGDRVPVTDVATETTVSFYLNAKYLRDALDAAGEDAVLHIEQSAQAIVLTTERGYCCIVSLMHPKG